MALTQVFTAGAFPSATKLNESSIPVVSATSDISAPYTGQVVFNTTDSRLYRYTGSAWTSFTSGPICSVTNVAGQSIANNPNPYVSQLFDTELIDTDNMHSTSTNTDRLTVVKAGVYMIVPKAHFIGNATGQRAVRLTLNGTTNAEVVAGSTTVANNAGSQGTSIVAPTQFLQLAVGDVIRMQVWQNSGGALNTESGSPLLSMVWLRD